MVYTYTSHTYGPRNWQRLLHGEPVGATASMPAIVYIPGGGWGLRDPNPIVRSDYAGSEIFMRGGLDDAANTYGHYQTYRVFVVQIASTSHNAVSTAAHLDYINDGWVQGVGGTAYVMNDVHSSTPGANNTGQWRCSADHTSTTSAPRKPTSSDMVRTWTDGHTYAIGEVVSHTSPTAGSLYMCEAAHTADTANDEPNLGTNEGDFWTADNDATNYWVELGAGDPSIPRLKNRGEGSPAYAQQAILDTQRAVAWVRKNAVALGVNPNKIALAGSSAGGQAAGCAAYASAVPFGGIGHPASAHPYKLDSLSTPNAVLLSITPAKLDLFAASANASQGGFLSFMGSMYGRSTFNDYSTWDAFPDEAKRSLDVYWTAERSGVTVPTYLQYGTDLGYDDLRTPTQIRNGQVPDAWSDTTYSVDSFVTHGSTSYHCTTAHSPGSPGASVTEPGTGSGWETYWTVAINTSGGDYAPDVHSSLSGKELFNKLSRSAEAGGWGQDTHVRMFLRTGTPDTYRQYHTYSGNGSAGFDPVTWGSSVFLANLADDILQFLNTEMI